MPGRPPPLNSTSLPVRALQLHLEAEDGLQDLHLQRRHPLAQRHPVIERDTDGVPRQGRRGGKGKAEQEEASIHGSGNLGHAGRGATGPPPEGFPGADARTAREFREWVPRGAWSAGERTATAQVTPTTVMPWDSAS